MMKMISIQVDSRLLKRVVKADIYSKGDIDATQQADLLLINDGQDLAAIFFKKGHLPKDHFSALVFMPVKTEGRNMVYQEYQIIWVAAQRQMLMPVLFFRSYCLMFIRKQGITIFQSNISADFHWVD
jgi:hypothetical protein